LWELVDLHGCESVASIAYETFCGGVGQRDLAVSVNGYDATVHGAKNVLNILVYQDDLAIQLGILHSDGRLIGNCSQKFNILRKVRIS